MGISVRNHSEKEDFAPEMISLQAEMERLKHEVYDTKSSDKN